jgi:hypothetical protein
MPPKTLRSVPLQQQQQPVRDTNNVYHQQQDNSYNQFQTNNGKKASPFSRPHSKISMSTSQQMIDSPYMSRSIENFDQQQPKPQQQKNIHLSTPRMSRSLGPQQMLHQKMLYQVHQIHHKLILIKMKVIFSAHSPVLQQYQKPQVITINKLYKVHNNNKNNNINSS